MTIIWSDMLPRLYWHNAKSARNIDSAHKDVNRKVLLGFFYYPHHMNMIIDRFAAKVGEPWILQTNLTKCFVLQKYNVTGKVLYREKIDTKKKKEKKKEEQTSHLNIIRFKISFA